MGRYAGGLLDDEQPQRVFIIHHLNTTKQKGRRRGGLVVSELDFRSRGRWFEPGHCRRVVSLDKKLYSTLFPFTQVYKWVPAIIMLGGNLAMD